MENKRIYLECSFSEQIGTGIADFINTLKDSETLQSKVRNVNQKLITRWLIRYSMFYKFLLGIIRIEKYRTIIYQIVGVQIFMLKKKGDNYLINPYHNFYIPFSCNKYICTIHDLVYLDLPNLFKPKQRIFNQFLLKWSIRNSFKIITVSNYTASAISNRFRTKNNPIIIYNSYKNFKQEIHIPEKTPKNYFFYFGGADPRKNLNLMFKIYRQYREFTAHPVDLICTKSKEDYCQVLGNYFDFPDGVLFVGKLKSEVLHGMMSRASLIIYLSEYEGFGRPVMEASVYRKPILVRKLSVYSEIEGANLIYHENINKSVQVMESLGKSSFQKVQEPLYNSKFKPKTNVRIFEEIIESINKF